VWFHRWSKVKRYWINPAKPSKIVLQFSYLRRVRLKVPPEHREQVLAILAEKVGPPDNHA